MPNEIQLIVAPSYAGDMSCARLDSIAMEILQVKEGEKVLVTSLPRFGLPAAKRERVKVLKVHISDEGKGIIRLSPDILNFSFGEKVIVLKES